MRYRPILAFSTVALLLSGCGRMVGGTITDKATSSPVVGASVYMKAAGSDPRETKSDTKGRYRISKDKTSQGSFQVYKFGYDPFSFDLLAETKKDFWLRPSPQETVRRILALSREALLNDKLDQLNEVYQYLHNKDKALRQLPKFKQDVQMLETFFTQIDDPLTVKDPSEEKDFGGVYPAEASLITERQNVTIKAPQMMDAWINPTHNSLYKNVVMVPVEAKKLTGGSVNFDMYLVLSDDYWHYFWYTVPGFTS